MNSNQQLTKSILDLSFSAWENDLSLNEQQQYRYHKLLALGIKVLKLNDNLTGIAKTKVEKFCNTYAKLCGQGLDFNFDLEGLNKADKAALTNKLMLILPQICEFTARESENYFSQVKYLADANPFSLQGVRVENAKLIGLNLSLCNLQDSYFKDCQLKDCDLTDVDMTRCYIDHCEVIESTFIRTKLLKAKINNSKLQGNKFNAADMRNCRINQSNVNQCDFKDAQTALVFILAEVDRPTYEDLKFNVESLTASFAEQNEPLH